MKEISSRAKAEIFASQTGAVFLSLLEISHPGMTALYLVNNNENITFEGRIYTAYPFRYTPPSDCEGAGRKGKLTLPNIDREILATVRGVNTPLTVRAAIIMILPDNTASREAGWYEYDLKNLTYNAASIEGELSFNFELGDNISMVKYNNLTFPGIYD